jgi:hypothetical protein
VEGPLGSSTDQDKRLDFILRAVEALGDGR